MPRNISTSKKYLPARSNAPSPSSHFLGGGNRKPGGGGPAGVAARGKVVEKSATVAGEGRRPAAKAEGRSRLAAGRVRASMVNGRVLAIVGVGWSRRWGVVDVRGCDEVGACRKNAGTSVNLGRL